MHPTPAAPPTAAGPLVWYQRVPLYLRILVALVLGIAAGYAARRAG